MIKSLRQPGHPSSSSSDRLKVIKLKPQTCLSLSSITPITITITIDQTHLDSHPSFHSSSKLMKNPIKTKSHHPSTFLQSDFLTLISDWLSSIKKTKPHFSRRSHWHTYSMTWIIQYIPGWVTWKPGRGRRESRKVQVISGQQRTNTWDEIQYASSYPSSLESAGWARGVTCESRREWDQTSKK